MKNCLRYSALAILFCLLTAASLHKFYVGIYQVNYASDKKMLQVTTRIFLDDLNEALEQKHKKNFYLGESNETPEEVLLMAKYITDNFTIGVNGKPRTLNYLSYEIESNVMICYFKAVDVPKIQKLQISNKILFEYVTEQQNIIQTTVNGQKNSLLLTNEKPSGAISF